MDKFRPFMKAIAPAVLTLIAVGVDWLVVGTFDRQTAAIAITGLAASIITYFVPNAAAMTTPVVTPTSTVPPSTSQKVNK